MTTKEERKQAIIDIFNRIAPSSTTLNSVTASCAPLPGPEVVYKQLVSNNVVLTLTTDQEFSSDLYVQGTTQPPIGWETCFNKAGPSLWEIWGNLKDKDNYLPRPEDVFRAFRMIRPEEIKVVIFGQDPYHQVINGNPRATGLAFSQHRWDGVSVSLNNIYKEIKNSYPDFVIPKHGDLSDWCKQGVMLLNTCLTVTQDKAGSHGKIWFGFINLVIQYITEKSPNTVFVMWGNSAQKLSEMISTKNLQLTAAHPSGFSAHRGFFGCDFARKINDYLVSKNITPINWQI